MRTIKAITAAAVLGTSALSIQAADAGWFGPGPFGPGYGYYPAAAFVPPPYWAVPPYAVAPYATVPPGGIPAPWAIPGAPQQTPGAEKGQTQPQSASVE